MITYLLMCIISILAGQGQLWLIGLQVERRAALYLAPVITLVLWTTMLGIGVSLGFPVRQLWLIGWLLTILLAFFGVRRRDHLFLKNEWMLLMIAILLPIGLMAPYFWYGLATYLGSPAPDGWSYIAYGQYLWQYPRGTEGGLAPLYQYAAHLSRTRFIASALLGFFSPIAGPSGDTQAASGYFLAWALFVFSSTCVFLAVVKRLREKMLLFYVVMSVFSGWLLNLLLANNYDNVLAISFLPAFAGVIQIADPRDWRFGTVLAGLAAGILYCYPEMAAFVFIGAVLCLLRRLCSEGDVKAWMILLFITVTLAVVLTAPFIKDLVWFLKNQSAAVTKQGPRPGEGFFPELLIPKYRLMAFWGFGGSGENLFTGNSLIGKIRDYSLDLLAIVLSLLAVLGMVELYRRREWGIASTFVLLFTGSLIMIFYFSYSYGAYKFIVLNWWGMCFAVVMGMDLLMNRLLVKQYRLRTAIPYCLFLPFLFLSGLRILAFSEKTSPYHSVLPFKQVEQVKDIVREGAAIVAVSDGLASEWAVYFLRDAPIYLAEYRIYMAQPHVVPLMERAQAVEVTSIRHVLTDTLEFLSFPQATMLWSGGPYYLWRLTDHDWIFVSDIQNGNGIEHWGGVRGFWLGKDDTEIHLISAEAGQVMINGRFIPGPSLPDKSDRKVLIFTDQGYQTTVTIVEDGSQTLLIPVTAGRNRLFFRPLDKPTLTRLPNGDTRPLLIGVRGLKVIGFETPRH